MSDRRKRKTQKKKRQIVCLGNGGVVSWPSRVLAGEGRERLFRRPQGGWMGLLGGRSELGIEGDIIAAKRY